MNPANLVARWGAGSARRTTLLVMVIAAVATWPSAAPVSATAPDEVVDCHTYAYYPNVLISSARNMSCRAARRDLRRYRGSISRRFRTPGGFQCSRVSGVPEGGQWRCAKASRAYRFEFGD